MSACLCKVAEADIKRYISDGHIHKDKRASNKTFTSIVITKDIDSLLHHPSVTSQVVELQDIL